MALPGAGRCRSSAGCREAPAAPRHVRAEPGSGVGARIFPIFQSYSVLVGAGGSAGEKPVRWGGCTLLFTSSSLESLRRRLCPNAAAAGPRLGSREQERGQKNDFRIPIALWHGRLSEPKRPKCSSSKPDWVILTHGTFLSKFTPPAESCSACLCCRLLLLQWGERGSAPHPGLAVRSAAVPAEGAANGLGRAGLLSQNGNPGTNSG